MANNVTDAIVLVRFSNKVSGIETLLQYVTFSQPFGNCKNKIFVDRIWIEAPLQSSWEGLVHQERVRIVARSRLTLFCQCFIARLEQ